MLHEGGYRVVVEPSGELTFYTPSGSVIPAVPPLPGITDATALPRSTDATAETLETRNQAAGVSIDAQTLGTWQGDRPDYAYAIEGLWTYRRGQT